MSGVAVHTCRDTDEMGDPYRPDVATCGTCGRSWCFACHPTPASLCPWCNGDGSGVEWDRAAIPPRQARSLARMAPPEPWQIRPRR